MIYFLYGTDEYRLKQRAKELSLAFEKKAGADLIKKHYDLAENKDIEGLEYFFRSDSLFGEKKKVIIWGAFKNKNPQLTEIIKKQKPQLTDNTLVIIVALCGKSECSKKDRELYSHLLKKENKIEEILDLSARQSANWIQKKIENYGLKATPEAIKKLAAFTKNNPRLIAQEIEKLASYKAGGIIDEKDIELLVPKYDALNAFGITDAVSYGNKAKAVELFYSYKIKGEDMNQLFGALIYQFRNLLVIREMADDGIQFRDISRQLKLHPFVMRKSYDMAKKMDLEKLKKAFNRFSELELGVKSGKYEISEAIFDFIVKI